MVVLQQWWRLQSKMLSALRTGDSLALETLLDLGLDADLTFQLGGCRRPALCSTESPPVISLFDFMRSNWRPEPR